MVARYYQTLQELKETDLLLESLQSFPFSPMYYTLPDCVQKGKPVFYLDRMNQRPEPGGYVCSLLSDIIFISIFYSDFPPPFCNFWKPVSIINVFKWHKWFHTHRIGVILKHDLPLPK